MPVLSSTATSTWRVCSSTSPPLMTMPSCAPRPVPTMIAVGVARPSAHGQAMIEYRDRGGEGVVGGLTGEEPDGERAEGDHEHDRYEHAGDAVGQALYGAREP